jgi:hypothetical protein
MGKVIPTLPLYAFILCTDNLLGDLKFVQRISVGSDRYFLLWPDDGSFMSRNLLPIKRLLNDLLGPIEELNKIYTYK